LTDNGARENLTSQAASESTAPLVQPAGGVPNSIRCTSPAVFGFTVVVATTR